MPFFPIFDLNKQLIPRLRIKRGFSVLHKKDTNERTNNKTW